MFLPSDMTLQFGDSGDFVAEMQRRLVAVSAGGKNLVTGHFDGMTVNAVSSFQGRNGLRADGIAGPDTLRRLNAVYSGDAVTESDTKKDEEENAKAAEAVQREAILIQQAAALSPEPVFAAPAEEKPVVQPASVTPTGLEAFALPTETPKPAIDPQAQLREQAQRDALLMQQTAQQTPSDMLAQMLLNQPPAQPLGEAAARAGERTPLTERPPLSPQPVDVNALLNNPSNAQNAAPDAAAKTADATTRDVTTLTREPQANQPTLMQRGMQMANAALQKVADYFEAKLPSSVLREVQDIGKAMNAAGVKEVAIPTGPELAGRGPDLPARGPEQQTQIGRS